MNNDIRISCSFPEHYKTKKLIAIAGNAAPFSLISLWVYAARNKPDGFLDNMDNFDIEIAANWNGQSNLFFDALVKCKFLEVADEGYYLHDWQVHQPYASSAEERSDKARFAILARHNRDMHTKLKEQGVNGLSVAEYKKYTKRIRPENDSNTKTYKNLTPSPLPSPLPYPVPLPAPEPLPSPKDNNTPAFFDKKASDDLPFIDDGEKKEYIINYIDDICGNKRNEIIIISQLLHQGQDNTASSFIANIVVFFNEIETLLSNYREEIVVIYDRYFENKHKILLYIINWYWNFISYKIVFGIQNKTNQVDKLNTIVEIICHQDNQKFDCNYDINLLNYI